MVFGTATVEPGVGISGSEGSLLGNGGKEYSGSAVDGQQRPVELLLRLDDAVASPTTPQGPQP
jgi:hypothetical protein